MIRSPKILVLPLAVAASLAAPSTAGAVTCEEISDSDLLVTLSAGDKVSMSINSDRGQLVANGQNCADSSVPWSIEVLAPADSKETLTLMLRDGGMDDYSWTIDLGAGTGVDLLTIVGTSGGDHIEIGTYGGLDHIDFDNNDDSDSTDALVMGVDKYTLRGGDGNDRLQGWIMREGQPRFFTGRLSQYGQAGNDLLLGGNGKDYLSGGDGTDFLTGYDGNDLLIGGSGSDTLNGDDGNDSITGGPGNDVMTGGPGNDTFNADTAVDGNDDVDGGDGNDWMSYRRRAVGLTVDLAAGFGGQVGESDALSSIEFVRGGSGDDVLIGDDNKNKLYGYDGNDSLYGGLGNDTLVCGNGDDTWSDPDSSAHASCEIEEAP